MAEDCCISEEEDSVHEMAAKYYNLRSSVVDTRKISLTCESLQFRPQDIGTNNNSNNNNNSTNNNNYLGEPKKNGRLRSPAPSPIPSPVNSPSPVRSRFQVSKVNENQNSCPFYVPSGAASVPLSRTSSRFRVTVVDAQSGSESSSVSSFSSSSSSNNNSVDTDNPASPPSTDTGAPAEDGSARRSDPAPPKKAEAEPKTCQPITEKIRKLSWVSPILQAPAVAMESAKIPANLEKLLGLFQNPFVRSPSPAAKADICCDPALPPDKAQGCPSVPKANDSGGRKWSADSSGKGADGSTPPKEPKEDSSAFPATWPQKISPTYGPSPSKSSPNILEATAFVLLQGHVSGDLARE